jgi:hypothetical protein
VIQSWIEEYGPVISLKQGSDVLVIIGRHNVRFRVSAHATFSDAHLVLVNDPQEATQLLEKQGACFADRPHSIAGGDILGRGMRFMLLSTCERLRRFRKRVAASSCSLAVLANRSPSHRAAHCHFQPKATLAYDADQTGFARNIVIDLLDDPESHQSHVKR